MFFFRPSGLAVILPVVLEVFVQLAAGYQLRAAVPAGPGLRSRAHGLTPIFSEHELLYIDDEDQSVSKNGQYDEQSVFIAKVRFSSSQHPLLHLDHATEHFSHIFCGASCSISSSPLSTMEIHFVTREQVKAAQEAWKDTYPFVLITSDAACAADGDHAHQAYLVHDVHFFPEDTTAQIIVQRKNLYDTANEISVEFGKQKLRGPGVSKRQSTSMSDFRKAVPPDTFRKECSSRKKHRKYKPWTGGPRPSGLTNATETSKKRSTIWNLFGNQESNASSTGIVNQESPTSIVNQETSSTSTSTVAPTATAVNRNLNSAFINTTILPPDPNLIVQLPHFTPPLDVNMICRECVTVGNLEIMEGAITMKSSDNFFQSFEAFADSDYIGVALQGLHAHIALEVGLAPAFESQSFIAYLPGIAVPGLAIPGVGSIGPRLQPEIVITIDLNEGLDFEAGFDIEIPDSYILVNVTHPENSTSSAIQQSSLSPLPFSAKTPPPSLSFSVAFRPTLLFGFTSAIEPVNGYLGVFLDMPKLNATVEVVHNVSDTCTAPLASSRTTTFDTAYQVTKSVVLDVGAEANLKYGDNVVAVSKILKSTVFNLASDCLIFDNKTQALQNATVASSGQHTTMKSTGVASARLYWPSSVMGCLMIMWTHVFWYLYLF